MVSFQFQIYCIIFKNYFLDFITHSKIFLLIVTAVLIVISFLKFCRCVRKPRTVGSLQCRLQEFRNISWILPPLTPLKWLLWSQYYQNCCKLFYLQRSSCQNDVNNNNWICKKTILMLFEEKEIRGSFREKQHLGLTYYWDRYVII